MNQDLEETRAAWFPQGSLGRPSLFSKASDLRAEDPTGPLWKAGKGVQLASQTGRMLSVGLAALNQNRGRRKRERNTIVFQTS